MLILLSFPKAECVRTLKGLALPRASHSGEIALQWAHVAYAPGYDSSAAIL